jgi:hypothetical protein
MSGGCVAWRRHCCWIQTVCCISQPSNIYVEFENGITSENITCLGSPRQIKIDLDEKLWSYSFTI